MIIYFVILLAVISRFVPHMPNFAPITALAIFAAANMEWKKAFGITFAARFISDIFIGFVSWPLMVAIYASHLVGILFGVWIKRSAGPRPASLQAGHGPTLQGQRTPWFKIIASSLGASAIFFLVTNFAFLYKEYSHTWSGIVLAYANGLPFLRGTLLGDLSYTAALFGAYELVKYFISKKSSNQYLIPNT